MNIFEKAMELENSTEAELNRLYKERDKLKDEVAVLLKSPMIQKFKDKVVGVSGDIPDEATLNQYMAYLDDIIDTMKALKIYDKTIILLETGYDPEEPLILETDMEFPAP